MVKVVSSFCAIYLLFVVSSCSLIENEAAPIPAYIYISSYNFVTDTTPGDNYQGANSEGFNDMWIFRDGLLSGGIGLPAFIPVQKLGNSEITIDAGISRSGQNNERIPYPLMQSYREVRNLQAGKVDTIVPQFRYLPNVEFKFIEDYKVLRSFKINPLYYQPGDTITLVNDERAWRKGDNCGKIQMAAGNSRFQLINIDDFELNPRGAPVYFEIDYKSNLPIDIGYYIDDPRTGVSGATSVIQTFPNTTWRKIYINLTDELASKNLGSRYIFYIGIFNRDGIVPEVYIDNVKLVTLKS
jgi:hypothetical protein